MRKILLGTFAAALTLGLIAVPHEAQAWWRGGYGYGGGFAFFGPRVYIGPPVVYAPPQVYYAPAPVYAARGCFAGAYVCPLERPSPINATCSCPTNNGRAYGGAR